MDWTWSWQDPVALVLAASVLWWTWRGRGKSSRHGRCRQCPMQTSPPADQS